MCGCRKFVRTCSFREGLRSSAFRSRPVLFRSFPPSCSEFTVFVLLFTAMFLFVFFGLRTTARCFLRARSPFAQSAFPCCCNLALLSVSAKTDRNKSWVKLLRCTTKGDDKAGENARHLPSSNRN